MGIEPISMDEVFRGLIFVSAINLVRKGFICEEDKLSY